MHHADAGEQQRIAGSRERGTSGDDIVDQQHPQLRTPRTGTERRALQPLGSCVPGLRCPVAAIEQASARHPQLSGDRAGKQLCLVVPTRACPGAAGRRPRHNIDLAKPDAAHHQPRQLTCDLAAIAVLEAVYDLACDPLERQRRHDAGLGDLGCGAGERETAAVAERGAGLITTGAKGGEDHGAISTRRV